MLIHSVTVFLFLQKNILNLKPNIFIYCGCGRLNNGHSTECYYYSVLTRLQLSLDPSSFSSELFEN